MQLVHPLNNPETFPTDQVLDNILGKEVFQVYKIILRIIQDEFDLEYEWRYYKDGKSWLFKTTNKKKTIFWLSVWEKLIKTSFYFTERTRNGVLELPINEKLRANISNAEAIGKLIPLVFEIDQEKSLDDFREIVKYKTALK